MAKRIKEKFYPYPFCGEGGWVGLSPSLKPDICFYDGECTLQVFYHCIACKTEFMARYKPQPIKCKRCGEEIDDWNAGKYAVSNIRRGSIYAQKDDGYVPNVWYTVVRCLYENCRTLQFYPWVLENPSKYWEIKYIEKQTDKE
ncbi:MAG: hypothetical protein DRN20_03470 [Thermoplasmata archaeon]|nr:MAG: hypothetical protein DRN20_03470 [Thermoplasmata archaeon]